jgi:hypothetical protein
MARWATVSGNALPPRDFFRELTQALQSELGEVFKARVEVVPHDELKAGIDRLAGGSPYPVVSFDRAYADADTPNLIGYIDVTRFVDRTYGDLGVHGRDGYPFGRSENYNRFYVDSKAGPQAIVLVDDVIFSGENLAADIGYLRRLGRPVKQVIAGVGIGEGVRTIEATGTAVTSVRYYEDVIDEVCERDFFACVPLSGRTVLDTSNPSYPRWSAPYFEPFGNPQKWASVPVQSVERFSRSCLIRSITLWEAVERESARPIYVELLPGAEAWSLRSLEGMRHQTSVVTYLQAALAEH